jgi:hypothetical protein
MEKQQLEKLSKEELGSYKEAIIVRRAELSAIKAKGKGWTPALQAELDDIERCLNDISAIKASLSGASVPADTGYTPEPGTEGMVHAVILNGRRFNPTTGEEESVPYKQLFTLGEWRLFQEAHSRIGYSIVEVLYEPGNINKV